MKTLFTWTLLLSAAVAFQTGCKKPADQTGTSGPTLADTLRATCISPFVGHGDSSQVYLPTAFSPNGDGINDVYRLMGKSITSGYFPSFNIKIYDTTGVIVYQSGSGTFEWDGVDQDTHSKSTKYKFYVKVKYTTSGNITDSGGTYLYLLSGTSCVHAVAADTAKYRFPDQFDPVTGYNSAWGSYENYCH